ncbi:hypothetical protein Nepgr_010613 [Nepenthes gracilis]|uniref:Uncharacterized protein n=1 Tax=Nepenthes gracilis TaxID=150966 RepID=A0AAD3XL74_NEPGR|nr:hypothetical protein Nepgr_010613 [Nepenthes gracilis]
MSIRKQQSLEQERNYRWLWSDDIGFFLTSPHLSRHHISWSSCQHDYFPIGLTCWKFGLTPLTLLYCYDICRNVG